MTKYMVNCWRCGKEHFVYTKNPHIRVFCHECAEIHRKEHENNVAHYMKLRMEIMWERAMRTIEQSSTKIYELREAAETVLEYALNDTGKFASQHEMIAAIILINNKIKTSIQKTVGSFRVDFILSELKVVLEIDGYMHDYKQIKDCERDQKIRQILGANWEIVRIPTKYLEKNPGQLINAIKEVKKLKQSIRVQNNGVLADWYSNRDKLRMMKALKKKPMIRQEEYLYK